MTDVKELVLTIVRPLVSYPEEISLTIEESDDFMEYNLSVHPDDIGRVIGKQGRVAKAIRTIVYSVRTKGPKKIRLNIVD
ncbi:KH domain-containing protein [Vagococcus elongatus]|uniref:RNA-binding protein KhpA n=1 Tax=Vagococcus elongatus TaxID=180344 RepID=A0A430APS0_9ENTE|nr:KH domain-containing protein [Vagococcus elongatus]RSU10128.1 RNA-binding protein [Vagococcus elongatus]